MMQIAAYLKFFQALVTLPFLSFGNAQVTILKTKVEARFLPQLSSQDFLRRQRMGPELRVESTLDLYSLLTSLTEGAIRARYRLSLFVCPDNLYSSK